MIAELTITPMCEGEDTADWLAMVVDKIDESGLDYQVTAMGTIIETDSWDQLMDTVKECHQLILANCPRVQTDLRIDEHKGRSGMLQKRVTEMEHLTGKELKHHS